jgi:gas vesicle protein
MGGQTLDGRGKDAGPRWAGRPILAALIRLAVLLVPIASGLVAGIALARAIPRPSGVAVLWWVLAVFGGSTLTVTLVERVARRLLPLATLLNLSLAFPDRVPSRFKLARQAGNVRVLQQRALEARERGLDHDPARAAETILTLVAALSAHDRKTRGHSERVRAFTDMLADEFELSPADRDRLRWAALLHDVGKLEVPSATLNKPGKPDEQEWETLKRHPLEGERIAAPLLPWLREWAAVIGQHHERWDGAGYPRGLSGEQIGLGARIVSVADSFEVMTAARSYKRPMTPNAARRELQRCAAKQFDPQVVRAFFCISLGRLWWKMGPASWVAQIPFMLGIGRTGGQAVTLARAASVIAINGLAGVLALGVGMAAAGSPARDTASVAVATADGISSVGSADDSDTTDDATQDDGETPSDDGTSGDDGVEPPGDTPGDDGTDVDPDADDDQSDDGVDESSDDEDPNTDDDVEDTVDDVVDDVEDTVDDVVDEVEDTVDDVVDEVEDTVDETVEDVEDAVDDAVEDVTDAVEDAVDDVVDGIG